MKKKFHLIIVLFYIAVRIINSAETNEIYHSMVLLCMQSEGTAVPWKKFEPFEWPDWVVWGSISDNPNPNMSSR